MEIPSPKTIEPNAATTSILQDVYAISARVDDLRPLRADAVDNIVRNLLGERVYGSNALEGNPTSLRETRAILETGHIAVYPRKREATEVRNLGQVIDYTQDKPSPEIHCIEEFLHVHQMLMKDIDDSWGGILRSQNVMIAGAKYQPPDPSRVETLLQTTLSTLKADPDVDHLILATWAHWAIARVHPFMDGNGRMARLWQDIVLFRNNLTCAIIRPGDREDYYSALQLADEGSFDTLIQLVAQRVLATFDQYMSVLQQDEAIDAWAKDIAGELDSRATEQRRLSYMKWKRRMEELQFEFTRCASRINKATDQLEVQVRTYDVIDQTKWENIRSGAGASATWLFRISIRRHRTTLSYIFFFGKHFWSDEDTELERKESRACVLISEDKGTERAKRLDELEGTPLSIREIFLVEDAWTRKRFDPGQQRDVLDRDLGAAEIAKDFISEALLR